MFGIRNSFLWIFGFHLFLMTIPQFWLSNFFSWRYLNKMIFVHGTRKLFQIYFFRKSFTNSKRTFECFFKNDVLKTACLQATSIESSGKSWPWSRYSCLWHIGVHYHLNVFLQSVSVHLALKTLFSYHVHLCTLTDLYQSASDDIKNNWFWDIQILRYLTSISGSMNCN